MSVNRQWAVVGVVVGMIIALIGMGWLVRDRFLPVEVGSVAPDFEAKDLQGTPVSFAEHEGDVVLLNIWATWCAPCREEMPSMQRLEQAYGARGLRIIAVSVDAPLGLRDSAGNPGGRVEEFAREMGLTFTIWHDPSSAVMRTFRMTKVPESFIIDRDGYIVKKVIGATDWNSPEMRALFDRLLEG